MIQYIPAYCPELNRIECLWKQINYYWLKPLDFLTQSSLREAFINDTGSHVAYKPSITAL